MDPLSGLAASINTSIRIFEVTYQLKAVGQQTADLLCTTKHVETNLNEARRLRRQKVALLNAGERNWIDAIISDTDVALRGVARLIEPARVDNTVKSNITFANKLLWVFRDNPQVRDKHARLTVCHQSLTTVISCLYSKDLVVIAPICEESKEVQPPPYDPQIEELFNWRRQRKQRNSFMNLQDTNRDLPSSTSSTSAGSSLTTTTVTCPMSGSAMPAESHDERPQSTASAPAGTPFVQPTSPFSSLHLDSVERPTSMSSVSNSTMFTHLAGSVVSSTKGNDARPVSANWGPQCSKVSSPPNEITLSPPETPSRSTMISPMNETILSPSEAPSRSTIISPMSDISNPTAGAHENVNSIRLNSLHRRLNSQTNTSSESERTKFSACNPYCKSTDSLPLLDGTSSTASWVKHHFPFPDSSQTDLYASSVTSTSDTTSLPNLPEIDSSPSAIATTGYPSNDPNNHLCIRQVYKPYRRPSTEQKPPSSAAISSTSSSSLFSTINSPRPERSYSDGQDPIYSPSRYPGEARYVPSSYNSRRYDPSSFMAELDSNAGHSISEHTSGDDMASKTGRPTSGVPSSIRRGGRSWLMFHASRSDLGHYMG